MNGFEVDGCEGEEADVGTEASEEFGEAEEDYRAEQSIKLVTRSYSFD